MGTPAARVATLLLLTTLATVGCERERWRVGEAARAFDDDLTLALGDTQTPHRRELTADQIPKIQYPRSLRPCCAFGADLKVAVGKVPVPGVELANLVDPDQVGPHRFDNGFLSLDASDERGWIDNENNGLVYTCRGGFIDLSHVRDNADNTLALISLALRRMESGGRVEAPPQGATLTVRLDPIPAEMILRVGERRLATSLARWLAYQLSIWHEIATYYGYTSTANWPEKISAFSPEDLYSNQLGVRIAAGIVVAGGAKSDPEYHASMDAWIARTLERLEAVPVDEAHAAMQAVDGAWWDSTKRIPDWTLVLRRELDTGPELHPWRLERASRGSRGPVEPLAACRDAAPPLVLQVEEGIEGHAFEDHAAVEITVDEALTEAGFPFPRADSRTITQRDFPGVIATIRGEILGELGPGADRP